MTRLSDRQHHVLVHSLAVCSVQHGAAAVLMASAAFEKSHLHTASPIQVFSPDQRQAQIIDNKRDDGGDYDSCSGCSGGSDGDAC